MTARGKSIAGKYELLAEAGTGGMATVWRGLTRGAAGFTRPVAIKRILPQLVADEKFVEMFIEEARVVSELQHPNIVQIHDFGEEDGDYFLVMEWVEGIDLGRHVRSYTVVGLDPPWQLIAAIGIEVCRALSAAHERSEGPVIHRDVTPQNILIGVSGIVKLTDFGLSRAADRGRMTNPDIVKGKLSYLAPELTFGEEPSAQSDLFSFGVVLWESLTGHKLFTGDDDVDVVLGVREAKVPSLEGKRPGLPEALYGIVEKALEKEPADRFASADEMGRKLASLLRDVDVRTDTRAVGESVVMARERLEAHPEATLPNSRDNT